MVGEVVIVRVGTRVGVVGVVLMGMERVRVG